MQRALNWVDGTACNALGLLERRHPLRDGSSLSARCSSGTRCGSAATTSSSARAQGLPPVLHFEYETLLDARTFERPVNYALVRIIPPEGVTVDPKRRPYIIIDPRAGHGPGIGGFKDDSQAGVALRDGHPVYFVIFFPEPEPGQTLLDVCDAERSSCIACANCTRTLQNPPSSAIARAVGRR